MAEDKAEPGSNVVHHTDPKAEDPAKAQDASRQANIARMQPGNVETDATTGQRVIHPAANPQQVNPIHDDEHEAAAVAEAKVLTDKEATPLEKIGATEKSNEAEGAPSAVATAAHEQAVKDDQKAREEIEAQEKRRRDAAKAAAKNNLEK